MPGTITNTQVEDPVTQAQQEIEQSQKEMAEAFKSLNKINPLAASNPAVTQSVPGDVNALNTSLENILSQPLFHKYVKLVSSPDFGSDLTAVLNHPARTQCLEAELGWFLFILVFRTWRYSKSKHWTKNLWIYLWTTLLFWVGAFYFIPHYFMDGAYDKLSHEIVEVIKQ